MSVFGGYLRQSTQVKIPVGPLVDATDGSTLESSVSFGTTDIALLKHDATALVDISANTVSAHLGAGVYNITLTASNTDTVGRLSVIAYDSAHRPYRVDFQVLEEMVFDSLFAAAGTDYLDVNVYQVNANAASGFLSGTTALNADVTKINTNAASGFLSGTDHIKADVLKISGSSAAADNQEAALLSMQIGTVQTGSTTTTVKTNLTETTNDHYNGRLIAFVTGALQGQIATITDYSGASKDLTVSQLTESPTAGDTFIVV